MKIKTNHQYRELLTIYDLPEKDQKKLIAEYDADSIEELEEYTFFKYKKQFYNLSDFIRIPDNYWHGGMAYTAFSGLCIKFNHSCDAVMVGYYYG